MELSEEQIKQFNEEGYIFLPSCFSKDEITVLNDAAAKIYKSDREEFGGKAQVSPVMLLLHTPSTKLIADSALTKE